jgi:putative ABC transport system permease protein
MILRFVRESISRAPKRKALIIAAIAMGSAVATAMLGVMLDIGDKINRELRSAGANIVVTSRAASVSGGVGSLTSGAAGYIAESDVPNVKKIFWGLNVLGYSPSLAATDGQAPVEGVKFSAIRSVFPAWQLIRGRWAVDVPSDSMIGATLARRNNWTAGSEITVLGARFKVAGIISSGDEADDRVFLPLAVVQRLTNRAGQVDRIDVAALTKPEDDFARKDPKTMTPAEYERWSCSNYVISMAHEIEQAIPGTYARPVRRVADSEGKILSSVGGLMGFITLAALLSAGLTVWSLTATTMMERRGEVAIMQAIGAARSSIAALFGLEIALIGLVGGIIGAAVGVWLAHLVGQSVFHDPVAVSWLLPFLIMLAAVAVALAGAAQPLRRTLRMDPAMILREGV